MKLNIEDYLQKIDNSFKEKTQKDMYMTYVMIFGLIFAFGYLLYWDDAEAEFITNKNQVVSIKGKIANDERYLQLNPASKITQLESETKVIENNILTFKDNNQYIKNKIEEISSLIYDEQKWGKYLHSISKNAKLNNVKILDFTNRYTENNTSFGHVLDINIKTNAHYKNTLNFINSLEQSDLVIDLHDLDIKATSKLDSTIDISVWGITY